jgi:hypothetical protein
MRSIFIGAAIAAAAATPALADTRDFNVRGFDRVVAAGPYDVTIVSGRDFAVRAEGDREQLEKLEVYVEGGELKIRTERGFNWSWGSKRSHVRVTVAAPEVHGVAVAGSGDVRLDHGRGRRFEASVAGSGNLTVAEVRADEVEARIAGSGDADLGGIGAREVDIRVAGSGKMRAHGRAERVGIKVAGSGDVDVGGLQSRAVSAAITGSGNVRANARDVADVAVTGSGDAVIVGGARCSVAKRGSGRVRCGVGA